MKKFIFALLVLMSVLTATRGYALVSLGDYDLSDIVSIGRYRDSDKDPNINLAISRIGYSARKRLVINRVTTISQDCNVPDNIDIEITSGGRIDRTNGSDELKIHGAFQAGPYTVFGDANSWVTFGAGSIKEACAEWWGAVGDYVASTGAGTECAAAINAAMAACKNVRSLAGNYKVSSSIFQPAYCRWEGSSTGATYIYPATSGASWTNNYVVLYNSTDGSTWTTSYPTTGGEISNIRIEGYSNSAHCDAVAIFSAGGGIEIKNCRINKMLGGVYASSNYNDQVTISHCAIGYSNGSASDYDIKLGQLGDALSIENCSVWSGSGSGVFVDGCWGGSIQNCILNCDVEIENSDSVILSGIHSESGVFTFDSSNVILRDSYLTKYASGPTIKVLRQSYSENVLSLQNVRISTYNIYDFPTEQADIDYINCAIDLQNVYRRFVYSGAIDHSKEFGILLSYDGVMLKEFNDYSHFLSRKCLLTAQNSQGRIEDMRFGKKFSYEGGIWYPLTVANNSAVNWVDPNGTYYYKAQGLIDPMRKIGRTAGSEQNITRYFGENGALLTIGSSGYSKNYITLRLYRGTSTGSYDRYIDVPLVYANYLYDDGNSIAGFKWKDRTAGTTDNLSGLYDIEEITGFRAKVRGSAIPTAGTWTRTDEVIHQDPNAGEPAGWFCITSGTFSSATDATGDTDGSTAVITGMADTSDFFVGQYVSVSAGFPTTGPYKIISIDSATQITIDTDSDSSQSDITVSTPDPVFKALANLAS